MQFIRYALLALSISHLLVAETYVSGHASLNEANQYVKTKVLSTRYLAFRDLDPWISLIKKEERNALDFGSGLGFSTEYLVMKDFKVTGVDTNPNMIAKARESFPSIEFLHVTDKLPFTNKSFHLVFSSLVLFELSSLEATKSYLAEAKRVLNENGLLIAITGSAFMADPHFKSSSIKTNFSQNYHAKSGDIIKVHLNEINLTFDDYLWLESDYRNAFSDVGLEICAIHYPLGKANENYEWQDELVKSPFVLFLAAKTCPNQNG